MTQIQIHQDLADRLSSNPESVELRTEEGLLIGYFVPAPEQDQELWARARLAFTDEEIERAQSETGGRTLKETRDELEERWPST